MRYRTVNFIFGLITSLSFIAGCNQANQDGSVQSKCPANCKCYDLKKKTVDNKNTEFGIDVSHHNGHIDWELLKSKYNLLFVYIKATEGATHIDKNYKANVKGASKAGYRIGSYHFFRMTSSAHAQFKNFYRTVESVGKQSLIPMVDIETNDHYSISELQDSLNVFISLIKKHFGVAPMIYGTNRSYNTYCGSNYNKYHLYIGRYGNRAPIIKGEGHYTIWQYSENGKLIGIPNSVDIAKFHPDYDINAVLLP